MKTSLIKTLKFFNILFFICLVIACSQKKDDTDYIISKDSIDFETIAKTDFKEAERIADQTIAKAKATQNDTLFLKGYYYRTLLEVNSGVKEKALKDSELTLVYSDKLAEEYYKHKLFIVLGKYYVLQNEYAKAINYYLKARDYFEEHNDLNNLPVTYNGLGILYFEMGDFDGSISNFNKSFEIYNKLGDKRGMAVFYANMGNVYMIKEDFVKAKKYQKECLDTFITLKDTVNIVSTMINLSNIESNLKNHESSLTMLNDALVLSEKIKDSRLKERIYLNYGITYYETHDLDKAKAYFNKQIELTKSIKFPRGRLDALEHLAKIAKNEGKYKDYADYTGSYYKLKDSVYGSEIKQKIEELKWSNEFEKSELEKNLLRSKYDIEKERSNYLIFSIVLVILISVLITGIIWLSYNGNKKTLKISQFENEKLQENIIREQINNEKEKAENELLKLKSQQQELELDLKNREITSISVQLIAKNKLMTEIADLLERSKNSKAAIESDLKSILNQNQNQEKDWEQFREVFEKIHPNFFEKVKTKFPQLSTTDVRICAYIKIGMSLHEVSNLLNITMQSLHTSRYRIRKKLNLEADQNLDDFVNEI
ncbi:tetratricopeptide repeat protein [Flavobacterium suzhouense]|uniref:Tetratricopeptide repeat protein n=1 Tax=Flavobacterium suzhouense TaxID=1529638 RepID=A0ABW5NUN5_9FLAO